MGWGVGSGRLPGKAQGKLAMWIEVPAFSTDTSVRDLRCPLCPGLVRERPLQRLISLLPVNVLTKG